MPTNNVFLSHNTNERIERIAKALESIAYSLLKMANPIQAQASYQGHSFTHGSQGCTCAWAHGSCPVHYQLYNR